MSWTAPLGNRCRRSLQTVAGVKPLWGSPDSIRISIIFVYILLYFIDILIALHPGPSLENFHGGGGRGVGAKPVVCRKNGRDNRYGRGSQTIIIIIDKTHEYFFTNCYISVLLSVIIAGWPANQKVPVQGVADKLF